MHNLGLTSGLTWFQCFFANLLTSQSVRDMSNGLRSATGNLNNLGMVKFSVPKICLGQDCCKNQNSYNYPLATQINF